MRRSPDQPHSPIGQAPDRSRQLRALHERFVTDPVNTDLSSLRPVIAQSWMRSLQWNVSPGLRTFDEYRQPRVDEQLLRCAKPVLDDLERMSADTGVSIYLADQDGTIAAVLGEAQRVHGAERVAAPGTAMSEDITGTNSDGTALEEGRPVQVWGAEHFCEGMQHLFCTSVPVFDPLRRSVRAVLSLSMPEQLIQEADARSMALIAQGAAVELTQLLAARLAVREQALLASYLGEVRKRGTDSVVVMDDRTTIASKGALHMLGQSDYAVLAGYARESETLETPVEREVRVGPDSMLHVHARPITSGGETIGSVIRLRQPKGSKSVLSGKSAPRRTNSFDALIGESLSLRRALDVAATVVRRRMPTYVLGERGTGKSQLAEAISANLAQAAVSVDCARDNIGDRNEIASLRTALDSGAAVVLRHVDTLAPPARAMLTDLLAAYDGPPVVLTMSSLRDETIELTNALGGVEIEMPPLRNRREDIPSLVAHFLASSAHGVLRVSPPLLRALTEADWAGNVAQLKRFVDTAAARCSFSELDIPHLSEAHQRTIARNPLSRLEEAELQQIREALTDAAGNRVRAAELLQIGRSTLYRKIEMYTRRGYRIEG
ncbi:sigma-54-dependent Fis family transcriptional regulator [Mycolicibacterium setense]